LTELLGQIDAYSFNYLFYMYLIAVYHVSVISKEYSTRDENYSKARILHSSYCPN